MAIIGNIPYFQTNPYSALIRISQHFPAEIAQGVLQWQDQPLLRVDACPLWMAGSGPGSLGEPVGTVRNVLVMLGFFGDLNVLGDICYFSMYHGIKMDICRYIKIYTYIKPFWENQGVQMGLVYPNVSDLSRYIWGDYVASNGFWRDFCPDEFEPTTLVGCSWPPTVR